MTADRLIFRIHFRRNFGLFLATLAAMGAWYIIRENLPVGVGLWIQTDSAIRESLVFAAPLLGGWAAWVASRSQLIGVEDLIATTSIPRPRLEITTLATVAAWSVIALIVGSLVSIVTTSRIATWGHLSWASCAIALIAILTAAAVGYAAGTCSSSRFTPPAVTIALFAWLIYPTSVSNTSSIRYLSPLPTELLADVFFGDQPHRDARLAILLLGVLATALGVILLRGQSISLGSIVFSIGVVAAVAGGALLATIPRVSLSSDDVIPYTPVCENSGIKVCVHPAYRELLPDFAAIAVQIAKPLVGLPGSPNRVDQLRPLDTYDPNLVQVSLIDRSSLGPNLAFMISRSLVTNSVECYRAGSLGGQLNVAQSAAAGWLMQRAGYDPSELITNPEARSAMEQFASLSPEQRQSWLKANLRGLRTCRVSVESLP